MIEQTRDYNELIPPENPLYPWQPKGWQPLCYYCNQPIELCRPEAMYRQRVWASWQHVNPVVITDADVKARPELERYKRFMNGSKWHCSPLHVRPTAWIDDPRCHICGTQTTEHGSVCSAAGKPGFHATTLSQKEEELTRRFGWTRESETLKKERERVSMLEGVGALAVTGVVLGLLAWATGSLPKRRLDVNQTQW